MALEALRSEFSSGQKSAVDRVAALEEEVGWKVEMCRGVPSGHFLVSMGIAYSDSQ